MRDDLLAEQVALDDVLARLDEDQWSSPTASPGWVVADQVAHLALTDGAAALAITSPERFAAIRTEFVDAVAEGPRAADAFTRDVGRDRTPGRLLAGWRAARAALEAASAGLTDADRLEWFGPPMGARSFLTARLMETWAHGQDVVDAVGASRPPTDRLRHVVHLGLMTRTWSFRNRGLAEPEADVAVALVAPSGARWSFGPDAVPDRVTGTAEDFCLVVTQRRHVDDTDLVVEGAAARDWMLVAQAFAGPPTQVRPARPRT